MIPTLTITDKRALRRISTGFKWVYANEIRSLAGTEPGQWVELATGSGEFLAAGTVNPNSLIAVRILTQKRETPNQAFFEKRIRKAREFREGRIDLDNCRLVFAEADALPGFICDSFGGEVFSVQLNTAGAEQLRKPFLAALRSVMGNRPVMLKNESMFRESEGLETGVETGEPVPETVTIRENGLDIRIPTTSGQKTGYYFDQRENKRLFRQYAHGDVLDCFSYVGGFGLHAAENADTVLFVDSSATAITFCRENMEMGGHAHGEFRKADGFDALEALAREGRRFDLISLDPPAFIKNRKSLARGTKAYIRLNRLALSLLKPGGVLFSMSCSHLMDIQLFDEVLRKAVSASGVDVRTIHRLYQAPDHPVLPVMKETEYLKGLVLRNRP